MARDHALSTWIINDFLNLNNQGGERKLQVKKEVAQQDLCHRSSPLYGPSLC